MVLRRAALVIYTATPCVYLAAHRRLAKASLTLAGIAAYNGATPFGIVHLHGYAVRLFGGQ